jgi:hypothetical protein
MSHQRPIGQEGHQDCRAFDGACGPDRGRQGPIPACSRPLEIGGIGAADVFFQDTDATYWVMPLDLTKWRTMTITGTYYFRRSASATLALTGCNQAGVGSERHPQGAGLPQHAACQHFERRLFFAGRVWRQTAVHQFGRADVPCCDGAVSRRLGAPGDLPACGVSS